QVLDHPGVAPEDGPGEDALAGAVAGVRVGPGVEQELETLPGAVLGGHQEGRVAVLVRGVDRYAGVEQGTHLLEVVQEGGLEQGLDALVGSHGGKCSSRVEETRTRMTRI